MRFAAAGIAFRPPPPTSTGKVKVRPTRPTTAAKAPIPNDTSKLPAPQRPTFRSGLRRPRAQIAHSKNSRPMFRDRRRNRMSPKTAAAGRIAGHPEYLSARSTRCSGTQKAQPPNPTAAIRDRRSCPYYRHANALVPTEIQSNERKAFASAFRWHMTSPELSASGSFLQEAFA